MIPIIKILASNILNILNWFKNNFKVMALITISVLSAIVFFQDKKLNDKNVELDRLQNNVYYYQELNDSANNNNRVLKLTINELKTSNDSIVSELNESRKKLKIKDKELDLAQSMNLLVKLDTTIILKEKDFNCEIKPNELTSLLIQKKDSILTAKLDIRNQQTLFFSTKRQYKNKYKNWFCRLFKFDFKKHNVYKYNIINSNNLIKITDTRVIQITEK